MTSGTTHRIPGTLPPQATGFVGRQVELELSAVSDPLLLASTVAAGLACLPRTPGPS
jgi:hypothetical protein